MHPNKFLLLKLTFAPGEALWHLLQHLFTYQSHDKPLSIIRRITCWFKEGGKPAQAQTRLTISKAPSEVGACIWQGAPCRRCQEAGVDGAQPAKASPHWSPCQVEIRAQLASWDLAGQPRPAAGAQAVRTLRILPGLWHIERRCHRGEGGQVAIPISSDTEGLAAAASATAGLRRQEFLAPSQALRPLTVPWYKRCRQDGA